MSKGKIAAVILIAAFAGLALYQGWRAVSRRGAKKESKALAPVEVMAVKAEDFDQTINLTGTIAAVNQADVPSKVSGKIIAYHFNEGAWVERGQTVVTVDRDEVGVEFEKAVVEAPISGWLTRKYYDPGAQVMPSGPMTPGTPLFQLADYRRVNLVVSVPESDISKVRRGAATEVTIDAWPDQAFPGQVRQISPTVDYLSRTVKAEISLVNTGLKLRPGMYGRAEIKVKKLPKAIIIPSGAILDRDEGKLVFVVSGGLARRRPVEAALDLGDRTVLAKGLSIGDSLIVAGQHSVGDSSGVEIVGGR